MIMEIVGSVLITGGSTALGIFKGNKYKKRVELLKQFRNTIQMLETEIFYSANPLPLAFESIGKKVSYPLDDFYNGLSEGLMNNQYMSVYEAINDITIKAFTDRGLAFDKHDLEIIKGLGNVLGCSDRDDQIKHLRLFNTQLEQQIGVAEDSRKSNEKVYKNMGFIIGLGISIVLI